MERKISTRNYIIAFVITAVVFLLGLMLGLVVDQKRISYLQDIEEQHKLDYDSLQIQYLYISGLPANSSQSCAALSKTLQYSLDNLEKNRIKLEGYTQTSSINKKEYARIEREYLIAEIEYWLIAKKTRDLCNTSIVTVLNFYTNSEDCPRCDEQGFVLSYLKNIFKEQLLIFSFNVGHSDEPMVDIIKNAYLVNEYPTLIIDEESNSGFTSKNQLLSKVCAKLQNHEACKDIGVAAGQG